MKNKVLSLILALLMAASSASAVLADEAIADVDVEETAVVEEVAEAGQYDKAIAFLANYGIFKGISADDLGADLDVNRYQMALFVGRISTGWVDDSKWEDGPENWSEFTDISEGAVADYWGALSYANQKGIIEGYGNGKFGPYDGITYQNALTMVVRTLGYTGLDWPWGYIQKAVELGLTDGITDVAYTDELTRGETAQIIYNAMFAKTKAGSTLGLENFGVAFGWEKVIVTASDLNTFVVDKKDASLALKSDNTTRYYKDSNKPDAGTVAFQILNDDGTLADDVYYVEASELGLVGEHDDELAVGDAYYVLFEQDEDSNLVKVVAYESLLTETLVNAGKTDDEGEEVDYAIEEFLDEHTLVNKYSSNAYVNMTKSYKDEVMVFTANSSTIEYVASSDYAIAIDWATGDILVPVDADKDDDWKDDWKAAITDGKVDYDKIDFELKYSWNNTLKKYYEVEFDRDVEDFEDIAINWISEKEMEKLLGDYTYEVKATYKYGFNNAADSRLAKSAYAALKLFDTNLDGVADRGTYETYRLGYFENKQVDPDGCNCGKLDHYVVSDVNTVTQALDAYEAKEGKKSSETKVSISVREEGVKCKHSADRAWIVDDSVLVDAVDEDGEETGYYASAYVLYNYDAETGALKIVKNITDGVDEDSFVATGVVRGYNITKGTVVIGEETYAINGYSELLGNGFRYANDNVAAKAVYGTLLESLFNQYVTYVVVDGELVHIVAKGDNKADVIIVDSYAGLSADGYIVVNGYLASDLEYDQFRIGSYDGWAKGDYYYYLTEEAAEQSFSKGAIYAITSRDADEDVYYVSLSGKYIEDGGTYWYEVEDDVNLYKTTIAETTDGYMDVWYDADEDGVKDDGEVADVKMKSTDKYIIITKNTPKTPYCNVIVYEGKLGNGWVVSGDRINSKTADNGLYIIVNAESPVGFPRDAYEAGLALYLGGYITAADYNGNYAEDDTYLLGAVEYETSAINVLTGKLDATMFATNKKLDSGNLYYTMGDIITEDTGVIDVDIEDVMWEVAKMYPTYDLDKDAKYLVGKFTIDETNAQTFFGKKDGKDNNDAAEKWIGDSAVIESFQNLSKTYTGLAAARGEAAYHKGIIGDIVYRIVEYTDSSRDEIKSIKETKWSKFEDLVEDYDSYDYDVFFVYTVDGNIVCYICDVAAYKDTVVKDEESTPTNAVKVWESKTAEDVYIDASFEYTKTTTTTNGNEEVAVTLNGITLEFVGNTIETATHENIEENFWYFGKAGECKFEDLVASINITGLTNNGYQVIYDSIVVETYNDKDCDSKDCNLVKAIYIPIKAGKFDATTGLNKYEDVVVADSLNPITVTVTLGNSDAADGITEWYTDFSAKFDVYYDNYPTDGYKVNNGYIVNKAVGNVYAEAEGANRA